MKHTPQFRGPSLILLATVHILLFAAGLAAAAALRHGAPFVSPFAPAEALRSFFTQSPAAVRVSSFFLFGSAVPFGIFAVTTVSRLRYMRVRAAGTNIALLGGLTATIALLLSGIAGWVLSVPEVSASAPVVKAMYFLNFLLVESFTPSASVCWLLEYPSQATSCGYFRGGWSLLECSLH